MQKDWKNPSEEQLFPYRACPFYFITSAQKEDICYQSLFNSLSKVKEDGFGGIILFNKPMAMNEKFFSKEQYLGKEFMQMIKDVLDICTKLKLRVWLHDGYNCPPGTAGGRINKEDYPELTPLRLKLVENEVKIEQVPWGFPAFEQPKSALLHQQFVYETFYSQLKEYFGNTLVGIFSDADNRKVDDDVHEKNSPKRDYFPWSNNFKDTFIEQYGYDITPYLASIIKREDSQQSFDYWTHAGWLYQGWFRSNYEWCKKHGVLYSYHTSDCSPLTLEQTQRSQIYTEGKALNLSKHSDFPGTDHECACLNGGTLRREMLSFSNKIHWGREKERAKNPSFYKTKEDLRAKQVSSASFLNDRKGAFCEMFAGTGWDVCPQTLLEIASWQIMQGITFVCFHAYHDKLLDRLKYFPPPDFSHHSLLSHSSRYLNDIIAKNIYFLTLGKLQAPIAVLDISDDILRGLKDNNPYFELCEALNRLPYGYVIADEEQIVKNKDKFSLIITSGLALNEKSKKLLDSTGIPIISYNQIDQIDKYIDCSVKYDGYGKPIFMRRLLDDGQQLVAVANLYDGNKMDGEITIDNKVYPLSLESGEIGIFTSCGQIITDKKPIKNKKICSLKAVAQAQFEKNNIIPLEWFKNDNGDTVNKKSQDKRINFPFLVLDDKTYDYALFVPNSLSAKNVKVFIDQKEVLEKKEDKFYDDKGYNYILPTLKKGEHVLTIEKQGGFLDFENLFLTGNFDCSIKTENLEYTLVSTYGKTKRIPEKAEIKLSERSKELSLSESWTKQGQPFYSGGIKYKFELDLAKSDNLVLDLGEVRDCAKLFINGQFIGKRVVKPYAFDISAFCGKVKVEVEIYNSNANTLETHLSPSGLIGGGAIYN